MKMLNFYYLLKIELQSVGVIYLLVKYFPNIVLSTTQIKQKVIELYADTLIRKAGIDPNIVSNKEIMYCMKFSISNYLNIRNYTEQALNSIYIIKQQMNGKVHSFVA